MEEMSPDNIHGVILAVSSSIFIGSSFIIKKKGLKKAGVSGARAGEGGYGYLYEPWWWAGMITMIVGEIANFAAYAFAPAILVTPLGALSIIFSFLKTKTVLCSAVLAHFILEEKLHMFGILGCVLCVVGSTTIVLHAPHEQGIESVKQVWHLATEPADFFRDEPIQVLPRMDLHHSSDHMLHFANQLLEQGLGFSKWIANCYRAMWLCDHFVRNFSSPQDKRHGKQYQLTRLHITLA
ncbi:hypothetical protein [Arabidopsis thaliana]|nr:hypothetical protein [Arabidopsis thaliana]CAB78422.1 hypothetical protein [Arabidopsis thaliana]